MKVWAVVFVAVIVAALVKLNYDAAHSKPFSWWMILVIAVSAIGIWVILAKNKANKEKNAPQVRVIRDDLNRHDLGGSSVESQPSNDETRKVIDLNKID